MPKLGLQNILTSSGAPTKIDRWSLTFDGTDEYIDTGFALGTALGDEYADDLSVSIWFKANATSNNGLFQIGSGPYGDFSIRISSNELILGINNAGWEMKVAFTDTASWHHVVGVLDGENEAGTLLYLDGSSVGTEDDTFPAAAYMDFDATYAWIGRVSAYEFNGNISDVAVYTSALSSGNVTSIYNGGKGYNHISGVGSASLQAWWRMGDGAFDEFADSNSGLIMDETNKTFGTTITPSMLDNASMDGTNWTGTAANEWTITTNTATSFGAITDTDFAATATLYNYMSGANSTVDANLPLGVYKITGTLATAGTLPANTSALVWDSDTPRTHAITAGDFTIYEVADSVSPNHMFKFVANAEGQSFTLSNVEITPINGYPGASIAMDSGFVGDTP